MGQMDMQITSLNFEGKKATAVANFQTKGNGGPAMAFNYNLEDQGGKWVVVGKGTPAGNTMHNVPPQGAGAGDATPSQALPPGHPSIPPTGGTSERP